MIVFVPCAHSSLSSPPRVTLAVVPDSTLRPRHGVTPAGGWLAALADEESLDAESQTITGQREPRGGTRLPSVGTPSPWLRSPSSSRTRSTPVADIYAVGAVVYYLPAGVDVFDGARPSATFLPVRASLLRTRVPRSRRSGAAGAFLAAWPFARRQKGWLSPRARWPETWPRAMPRGHKRPAAQGSASGARRRPRARTIPSM
jgi:hypothetical protein